MIQRVNKFIFCVFIMILAAITPIRINGQGLKFEAENAVRTGSLALYTTVAGYSGTGYVGFFEKEGDQLTFQFNLKTAAAYDLFVGYMAPYGDKINNIRINGNYSQMQFLGHGNSFAESAFGKVKLRTGSNTVVISKSWGWFYVDYIRIETSTTPDTPFNISDTLVTPEPAPFAQREFDYMLDHFGKNIHAGVMEMSEANWLKTNTGKFPALLGLDFMNHTRNYTWFDKNILISQAINWRQNNGLLQVCWHWRDPLRKTEEFYTEKTTFDVSRISDTLSPEYAAMVSDIDIIASWLKKLQDERIPILFRPLHEAAGKWFWWGAKGPEPCKKLWKLIFNRLVYHHRLNNLIWVWTTDTQKDNLDWYPGDEYVDILGLDIYASNGDHGSQVLTFDQIRENFNGKKLITLSENGVMPDPDNLVADLAGWSWFMTWNGSFVRDASVNPLSLWQKIMDHPYVITLDEMPDRTSGTGIDDLDNPDNRQPTFVVLDQPSDNRIVINPSTESLVYDTYVFDIRGRLIFKSIQKTGHQEIRMSSGKAGIFLIKLVSPAGATAFKVVR